MLTSIALILLPGLGAGWIFAQLKLPSLLGMILAGIVISPHCLNWADDSILSISGDIRRIALVIILTRAGLSLNLDDLKKVGRPAVLMCFVPACLEMIGALIFAPLFLNVSLLDAAVTSGAVAGDIAVELLRKTDAGRRPVRLIGVGIGHPVSPYELIQPQLF